jgi:hypothetical protein
MLQLGQQGHGHLIDLTMRKDIEIVIETGMAIAIITIRKEKAIISTKVKGMVIMVIRKRA